MRKLKEKNKAKAQEIIIKANSKTETDIMRDLQRSTKLELDEPKVTEKEMYDIKKFAKSGVQNLTEGIGLGDDDRKSSIQASTRNGAATALLLDSNYSLKDELMSTYSMNQAPSQLGKRKVTT